MLRRPTAIKLLHPDRASAEDLARFEREVQITSHLTHPNTVAIYDYGRTPEGVFYYAMEYLPGIDLGRLVTLDGPQPQGRVIHVLRQVCGSLAEAHARGLIHRDIKPENVILCERGGRHDVAKVLDFGIVKDTTLTGQQRLTQVGSLSGTPLYLAPEAWKAPERIDARTDLYALGAVAYYLLTSRPLFDGKSAFEIYEHHVRTPPVSPSNGARAPILPRLEQLILRCLEKNREHRPRDAREVERELEACAVAAPWSEVEARRWWEDHGSLWRPGASPAQPGAPSPEIHQTSYRRAPES
jgi:serine/threonine protein kinase